MSDLIISEYAEGSKNNRAIELYNGTGQSVDLSRYSLQRDRNGGNNFSYFCNLRGRLADGHTLVVANPNADNPKLKERIDTTHQVITEFTGNDQIRLLKNGVEIDRIGIKGGANFGKNVTYVRSGSVKSPRSGEQDPRTNGEWLKYPSDYFEDLGLFVHVANTFEYGYDNSGNRVYRHCTIYLTKSRGDVAAKSNEQTAMSAPEPITEQHGERTVTIFPNPTRGRITLKIVQGEGDEFFSYTVLSSMGQQVLSGNGRGNGEFGINLNSKPSGVYVLVLRIGTEQTSYKIVKN